MRFIFSWFTTVAYSLIIIVFSVLPLEVPKQLAFPYFDKIVHGLIYLLLSFILVNTLKRGGCKRARLFSFSYSFLLGFGLEVIQFFLPYRDFQGSDIISNSLGGLIGCLIKII